MGGAYQRRLGVDQFLGFQQRIGYALSAQYRNISLSVGESPIGAEKLQRPKLPAFIMDTGFGVQSFQTIAAVFRQPHHAAYY